jgi:hypothetical protein
VDPLRAAQAEQVRTETALAQQLPTDVVRSGTIVQPIAQLLPPPVADEAPAAKIFEAGREVISVDPTTGQVRVLHTAPETPRAEPRFAIPFGEALPGSPAPTARLTAKEIRSAWNTLPDFTKNHAITRAILEAFPEGKSDARQPSPAGGQDTLIQEAQEAIRQGAPVEAVERELREKYGINVKF